MSHISKNVERSDVRQRYTDTNPGDIDVYKNDAVIRWVVGKPATSGGKRQGIVELTRDSLSRMVFLLQNTSTVFCSMVTLTYPGNYESDGKVVKGHLNRFLSWARTQGFGLYVWFMEFQKRGAPHFHILFEHDVTPKMADVSERWYRAVGSGDERHRRAGTRTELLRSTDGAARYAAKYASKIEQKRVPVEYVNVGRFWGASRGVVAEPVKSIDVWGMKPEELATMLEWAGWEYGDALRKRPLSVLFNAGKILLENEDNDNG